MGKIGICACYNSRNYGSMLQAYATQVAVEKLGYNSEYIVYKKKKTFIFLLKQVPRLFNTNLMFDKMLAIRKKQALRMHPDIQIMERVREEAFKRFQNNYYKHFSPVYFGYEALCKGARNYSSVLVGSDQLWTPGGLATNFYNLMFVPDEINRVSYATSFGVSKIPFYQLKSTKEYLQRINYLSVREMKGAEIINEVSGCEARIVADPTLLLTKEEWTEIIHREILVKETYIFCYFLGENELHRDIAEKLKNITGLKIVCTPYLDSFVERDINFGDEKLFNIGPDGFVNLVRGAEYILTDSFHGSVFSILYHKKFLTFNRYTNGINSRNSRIDSLLTLLGLNDRRYSGNVESISNEIDYLMVEKRLEKLRSESLEYLANALK